MIASEKKWTVVTTQKFEAIRNVSNLNVRSQLNSIQKYGVRIVLLIVVSTYTPIIMKQAKELDMINGWAWIAVVICFDFLLKNIVHY